MDDIQLKAYIRHAPDMVRYLEQHADVRFGLLGPPEVGLETLRQLTGRGNCMVD